MILLRYGIRCFMHYSVPVTLGLLAWNGSWQDVSRQILSESAGKPGKATNDTATIASKNAENAQSGTGENGEISSPGRSGSESIAMNPVGTETNARSLTIPRADSRGRNETASASDDRQDFSRQSGAPDTETNRAPRDRNIDATGHESPLVASASVPVNSPDTTTAPSNESVENTAAAASIVAAESKPAANSDSTTGSEDPTQTPQKIANAAESSASAEVAAVPVPAVREEKAESDSGGNAAKIAEAAPTADQGIEPADLKPEVRAIAAQVPQPVDESKPAAESAAAKEAGAEVAKADAEADRPEAGSSQTDPPQVAAAKVATSDTTDSSKKTSTGSPDRSVNVEHPKETIAAKPPEAIPDIVVAESGETWRRIASRVYGDEKMAEAIWKENRDAHGGSADSPPVAGRLVRLPSMSPGGGIRKAGTQLARTAR